MELARLSNLPAEVSGLNLPSDVTFSPEFIAHVELIRDEMKEYERVGMKEKARLTKQKGQVQIIAYLAEQQHGHVYTTTEDENGDDVLNIVLPIDGEKPAMDYYETIPLREYTGDIPLKILKSLPNKIAKKTVVFREVLDNDPVIAIPTSINDIYIGIAEWE